MKAIRNSYHTAVKIATQLGILPENLKQQIPKSSLHRFRNTDYSMLFGIEFNALLENRMDLLKQFVEDKQAQKVYRAYILLKSMFIRWFGKIPGKISFTCKEKIVHAVQRFRGVIGFDRILKLFKLTKHSFYTWRNQVKYRCTDSLLHRCYRTHPQQLTGHEVKTIRELYCSREFRGWSLYSIALYARIKGLLVANVNTWYKYIKLLKLSKPGKRPQYGMKRVGIRSAGPHEYWHADVTVFRTLDNVKAYIYFVMENFSRYILSYRVALKLSGRVMKENLAGAYNKFILPEAAAGEKMPDIQLLVDGGPENDNSIVDEYVGDKTVSLKKLLAGTDVIFSNSMVEAVNKTIKYQYLFHHDIPDFHALERHLAVAVPDYNTRKPHGALQGRTPEQVLYGKELDLERMQEQMRIARLMRIEVNRQAGCGVCG